jgi:hypothetical protein
MRWIAVVIALSVAGCGTGGGSTTGAGTGGAGGVSGTGGGSGGAGACVAQFPPGASMSWLDNGVFTCADEVEATYFSPGFLEVDGVLDGPPDIGFQVLAQGTTLGGSYACSTDTNPPQPYVVLFANGPTQSCTVTIDNPGVLGGAHVTGTFSAVFTAIAGGSDTLTEGQFDAPLR